MRKSKARAAAQQPSDGGSGERQQWPQELVPFGDLRPAPYNPREATAPQLHAIARSIVEFGVVDPLVARAEDLTIIGGHQRHKAIAGLLDGTITVRDAEGQPVRFSLPGGRVPVVLVSGLNEDRMKMLNLALNKATGDWSYDRLTELIADLSTRVPLENLTLTGFTQAELADLQDLVDFSNTSPSGAPPGNATRAASLALEFSSAKLRDAVKARLLEAEREGGGKKKPTGDTLAALLGVRAQRKSA